MCVVGVMQGHYYSAWDSYHRLVGQRLKVLQQNKATASKNYVRPIIYPCSARLPMRLLNKTRQKS